MQLSRKTSEGMPPRSPSVVIKHVYCSSESKIDLAVPPIATGKSGKPEHPKLTANDHGPMAMEIVFVVSDAPVNLFVTTMLTRTADGGITQSYCENAGVFSPRPQPYRFIVKDTPNIPGSSFTRIQYRLGVRIHAANNPVALFAAEALVSQRRAAIISSRDSVEKPHDAAGPNCVSVHSANAEWDRVPKQTLPATDIPGWTTIDSPTMPTSTKKTPSEVLRDVSYWLYSSSVGQYFSSYNDERHRSTDLKATYTCSPITMLGVTYAFQPTEPALPPPPAEPPLGVAPLDAAGASHSHHHHPHHDGKKRRGRESGRIIVPAPVLAAPLINPRGAGYHTNDSRLRRVEPLGELYCVRLVYEYSPALPLDAMRLVCEWLRTRRYEIVWINDTNLEAEEILPTPRRGSLHHNTLLLRMATKRGGADAVIVDAVIFAAVRSGNVLASLLKPNTSSDNSARAADAVQLIDRLILFLDSTAAARGRVVFRDGFNANVMPEESAERLRARSSIDVGIDIDFGTGSPRLEAGQEVDQAHEQEATQVQGQDATDHKDTIKQDMQEKAAGNAADDANTIGSRISGDLQVMRDGDGDWREIHVALDEDVLTFGEGADSTSIQLGMGLLSLKCDEPLRFDILFGESLFRLRAGGEVEYDRWRGSLERLVNFVNQGEDALSLSGIQEMKRDVAQAADKVAEEEWDMVVAPPSGSPQMRRSAERKTSSAPTLPAIPSNIDIDAAISTSASVGTLPLTPMSHNELVLLSFLRDFQSRFWMTYRKDFARIEPSFLTSDVGWGCMLRSLQMLLAESFGRIMLGRRWRLHSQQSPADLAAYQQLLLLFNDSPSSRSPYSIHALARMGAAVDKKVGEWFGPVTAAYVARRLIDRHVASPVRVYVNQEQTVYKDLAVHVATSSGAAGTKGSNLGLNQGSMSASAASASAFKPLLLLLPVRLGIEQLNAVYIPFVRECLSLPQSVGIAGGKPCRSLFFVAHQDEEIFYLDPHVPQTAGHVDEQRIFPVDSYHCSSVRATEIRRIDPTMLIAFLCETRESLDDFCERMTKFNEKAAASGGTACIHVVEEAPPFVRDAEITMRQVKGSPAMQAVESTDFEIL